MMDTDERDGLRCQVPDSTAETLVEWLQNQMVVRKTKLVIIHRKLVYVMASPVNV